jgi:hypothetical protein
VPVDVDVDVPLLVPVAVVVPVSAVAVSVPEEVTVNVTVAVVTAVSVTVVTFVGIEPSVTGLFVTSIPLSSVHPTSIVPSSPMKPSNGIRLSRITMVSSAPRSVHRPCPRQRSDFAELYAGAATVVGQRGLRPGENVATSSRDWLT